MSLIPNLQRSTQRSLGTRLLPLAVVAMTLGGVAHAQSPASADAMDSTSVAAATAQGPLTRAQVQDELRQAQALHLMTPGGEAGESQQLLDAREQFYAQQRLAVEQHYAALAQSNRVADQQVQPAQPMVMMSRAGAPAVDPHQLNAQQFARANDAAGYGPLATSIAVADPVIAASEGDVTMTAGMSSAMTSADGDGAVLRSELSPQAEDTMPPAEQPSTEMNAAPDMLNDSSAGDRSTMMAPASDVADGASAEPALFREPVSVPLSDETETVYVPHGSSIGDFDTYLEDGGQDEGLVPLLILDGQGPAMEQDVD